MVSLTMISGPYEGQTRNLGLEIDPKELLISTFQHGWDWKIDYSRATREEALQWGIADMVTRICRARHENRPVHFMDKTYQGEMSLGLAGEIEDAIVNSGFMVTIGRDDQSGLWIETGWPEIED